MILGFSGALQLGSGTCFGLATGTLCWHKCLHEDLLYLVILILPELFDIFSFSSQTDSHLVSQSCH